ncbi:MAG TPA: ROK family protein [Victivallales bacterium]|nr:ROK family protein [Victivallales bacterium]
MYTIGFDMGGTRIKIGIIKDGKIAKTEIIPALSNIGLEARLPAIKKVISELCSNLDINFNDCQGIGIACPGVISQDNKKIVSINEKYNDAVSLDLPAWSKKEFNLPLFIDNDARMACIGEWQYGAGRGYDNLVMMTLGTGIGTSAVVDGNLLRGSHGIASLLGGHFTINYNGDKCTCPNIGCSELEASTVTLDKNARKHSAFNISKLSKEENIEYEKVFKYAEEDDICAKYLLERSLNIWSITALNLAHAYDPEVMILGGGIMASADVIIPAVQDYVSSHSWNPYDKVKILRAEHGNNAALLASEWLINKRASDQK